MNFAGILVGGEGWPMKLPSVNLTPAASGPHPPGLTISIPAASLPDMRPCSLEVFLCDSRVLETHKSKKPGLTSKASEVTDERSLNRDATKHHPIQFVLKLKVNTT